MFAKFFHRRHYPSWLSRARNAGHRPGRTALAQPINSVGSQHQLEGNWNDENAMQKFEHAKANASRERRDEILSGQPRPRAVELRTRPSSVDRKSGPDSTAAQQFKPREHMDKQPSERLWKEGTRFSQPFAGRQLRLYLTAAIVFLFIVALGLGLYFA